MSKNLTNQNLAQILHSNLDNEPLLMESIAYDQKFLIPDTPIRIIAADSHPIILKGIESLLSHEPSFQLLATCTSTEDALSALRLHQPDLLLLDLELPSRGTLEILSEIANSNLRVKTILFANTIDDTQISKAIQLGVRGVLLKTMRTSLILQCLNKVHSGGQWLERKTVQSALEKILRRQLEMEKISQALTPRELDVAFLVAKGLSNKLISQKLHISEGSIKTYLYRIYAKLQINNRVALTLTLQERELI